MYRWKQPRKCGSLEKQGDGPGPPHAIDAALQNCAIDLVLEGHDSSEHRELSIKYGEKSNEELLFSHGFTLDMNSSARLMLNCHLINEDGDTGVRDKRLELLVLRELKPQFFLEGGQQIARALQHAIGISKKVQEVKSVHKITLMGLFPAELWNILDVIAVNGKELDEKLLSSSANGRQASLSSQVPSTVESVGLHMAKVAVLIKLLEQRMDSLEGEEGTGSLEDDIELMQKVADGATKSWKWYCLVYRAEQKKLTRDWLLVSRIHMQEVVAVLKHLSEKTE